MLVLSRKVGERILVGKQIRITVVRASGGGVRLGIEAPDGMTVVREELTLRTRQDQPVAAQTVAASNAPGCSGAPHSSVKAAHPSQRDKQ